MKILLIGGDRSTSAYLVLDPALQEARYRNQPLGLIPQEYKLLELLLKYPHRIFSRNAILDYLWNASAMLDETTITRHIAALRQKLQAAGVAQELIETVYGLGYRLKASELQLQPFSNECTTLINHESPLFLDAHQGFNPPNLGDFNSGSPQTWGARGAKTAVSQSADLEASSQFYAATSESPQEAVNEFMGELWEQFQSSFAEQIQLLDKVAQALSTQQVTPELWQAAKQECHKLAGSLGVFGYPQGSVLARELEEALGSSLPLPSRQIAKVSELVNLLAQEVERPPHAATTSSTTSTAQIVPVLLVDDDKLLAEQLKAKAEQEYWQDSLGDRKFRVEVVADPRLASLAIAQSPPKIVLLNLSLSNGAQTGLTLLQDLAEECPHIPVVVFTESHSLAERVEAARLGVRAFLQKPIEGDRLLATLYQILDQNPVADGKVLIVDDDPYILMNIRNLLQPWGLQVQTLDDPQQFLEVLNSFLPDLLVLDLEMPSFSGIDLCQVVRNDPEWGDLPILFLTDHTEVELIYEAFAVGGDDYIRKPIVEPELVTRIISRLDRVRLFRQLRGC